jgi:predicted nucleic-acid-binding protein
MNALDTNAVVRFLIGDDEKQTRLVHRVFLDAEKQGSTLFVSTAVLLETIWVLSSVYKCPREEIKNALVHMGDLPILEIENRDRIVTLCRLASESDTDLADVLIGLVSRDAGCETTLTFDRKASKSELFTLIA